MSRLRFLYILKTLLALPSLFWSPQNEESAQVMVESQQWQTIFHSCITFVFLATYLVVFLHFTQFSISFAAFL